MATTTAQIFLVNVLIPAVGPRGGKRPGEQKSYSVAAFTRDEAIESFKAEVPEEADFISFVGAVGGKVWRA